MGTAGLLWAWGPVWLASAAVAQATDRSNAEIVDFHYNPGTTTVAASQAPTPTSAASIPRA